MNNQLQIQFPLPQPTELEKVAKELDARWQVIDKQDPNYPIGTYISYRRAHNKAEKLDLEYGAYRYSVRKIYLSEVK